MGCSKSFSRKSHESSNHHHRRRRHHHHHYDNNIKAKNENEFDKNMVQEPSKFSNSRETRSQRNAWNDSYLFHRHHHPRHHHDRYHDMNDIDMNDIDMNDIDNRPDFSQFWNWNSHRRNYHNNNNNNNNNASYRYRYHNHPNTNAPTRYKYKYKHKCHYNQTFQHFRHKEKVKHKHKIHFSQNNNHSKDKQQSRLQQVQQMKQNYIPKIATHHRRTFHTTNDSTSTADYIPNLSASASASASAVKDIFITSHEWNQVASYFGPETLSSPNHNNHSIQPRYDETLKSSFQTNIHHHHSNETTHHNDTKSPTHNNNHPNDANNDSGNPQDNHNSSWSHMIMEDLDLIAWTDALNIDALESNNY